MSDPRTFGQVVREARHAKGMSMGQLATAVNRSTASVRRWERDEGVPAASIRGDVANALDLSPDDLELIDDEPSTEPPPSVAVTPPPSVAVTPPPPASRTGPEASLQATQAAASRVTGIAPVVDPKPTGVRGWFAVLYDPDKPWLGYLRAALTVIVLIVLAWMLIWSLGGLLDTLGEFWESMWAESP